MTGTDRSALNDDTSRGERLSFWQKIGYGVGDIYGGGSGVLVSFYYLVFLVDVVRIRPALAGTVILISKVYDSITDPFEGLLADRTRTPLGRRRPYLAAGVLFVLLSFFLLFYPFNQSTEASRFVSVVITYLFFSTVVSIVMLNYNALQAEITLDYHERTQLSSYRIFFSTVASILAAVLPLEIVDLFADVRAGWMAMGAAFGLFFALPFVWTVLSTHERSAFQNEPEPFSLGLAFIEPFRMRSFVIVLMMYLLAFVAIDALGSVVVFYVRNYLGRVDETSIIPGVLLVAQVASLAFYTWLSKRTSKRTAYMVGAGIWIAVMLSSFAITPVLPGFVIYIFVVLVGLGSGGIVVMIYAIFPDIPDIDELRSGKRREGTYAALFTFMRKLSSAFAVFLVAQSIDLAGYTPPVEQVVNGATRLIQQPQSAAFILVLRLIFALLPVTFLLIALIFAWRYPLSPDVHRRLNVILTAQREGQPVDRQEAASLEQLLFGKVEAHDR